MKMRIALLSPKGSHPSAELAPQDPRHAQPSDSRADILREPPTCRCGSSPGGSQPRSRQNRTIWYLNSSQMSSCAAEPSARALLPSQTQGYAPSIIPHHERYVLTNCPFPASFGADLEMPYLFLAAGFRKRQSGKGWRNAVRSRPEWLATIRVQLLPGVRRCRSPERNRRLPDGGSPMADVNAHAERHDGMRCRSRDRKGH